MVLFDEKGWFIRQKIKFKVKIDDINKISYPDLRKKEVNKPKLNKKRC